MPSVIVVIDIGKIITVSLLHDGVRTLPDIVTEAYALEVKQVLALE
ncbi:hypothetical protein Q4488_16645 [Amphritea sp. 1_MG-2023]|nr:hypothetical protein [Amphritea sp. 1_MG-2023]MDO6565011.1 hypothetical protein [Amphritea sp. 1_MG-2023]